MPIPPGQPGKGFWSFEITGGAIGFAGENVGGDAEAGGAAPAFVVGAAFEAYTVAGCVVFCSLAVGTGQPNMRLGTLLHTLRLHRHGVRFFLRRFLVEPFHKAIDHFVPREVFHLPNDALSFLYFLLVV